MSGVSPLLSCLRQGLFINFSLPFCQASWPTSVQRLSCLYFPLSPYSSTQFLIGFVGFKLTSSTWTATDRLYPLSYLLYPPPNFLNTSSHWTWSLPIWSDPLGNKTPGTANLHPELLTLRLQTCTTTASFNMGHGDPGTLLAEPHSSPIP